MTCIVGLIEKGTVWMAGDSAGVNSSYHMMVRADEKVFRNGPCLMGFTSSFRMGQLLRYAFKIPDHDPREDINRYMVTTFIDAVRKCLKDGGFQKTKDEVITGGFFLVAYSGHLFKIEDDYQVGLVQENYAAVGCGDQVALGSLFSTARLPPRKRILRALAAAERFSAGVRGPFIIKTMKQK